MSNPFEDMEDQRKVKWNFPSNQLSTPANVLQRDLLARLRSEGEHCSDMVCRVLNLLIDAAYPYYAVRTHWIQPPNPIYSEFDGRVFWSIGYEQKEYFSETGRPEITYWWNCAVVIQGMLKQGNVIGLKCSKYENYYPRHSVPGVTCGISEAGLIVTLRQIHLTNNMPNGPKPVG